MFIDRRLLQNFDWVFLLLMMIIPCLGLIVLYSAGFKPDLDPIGILGFSVHIKSQAFLKQFIYIMLGLGAFSLVAAVPTQYIQRYAYVIYMACLLLVLAVLIIGEVSHGSRRWIGLGSFNLQPSEMMKIGLILGIARYLSKRPPVPGRGGYGFKQLLVPFLIFAVPMLLILKQPDLGTAIVLGGVGFLMVLFLGVKMRAILIMVLVIALGLVPAWGHLKDYQKRRVWALINPDADPLGSGYHIIQSKIAVGSGAFVGKGFLKGTQTQLEFLPEHTTDFVFSVLAEEWGFVGCLLVMTFYLLLIFKLLSIVAKTRALFPALVTFGVAMLLTVHTVVNIGMVIGMLPVVGIPLPLFSYGGSSMLTFMFGLGLVFGARIRRWELAR